MLFVSALFNMDLYENIDQDCPEGTGLSPARGCYIRWPGAAEGGSILEGSCKWELRER
jgi:hypothetical protein